jgi:hypothetical protein
MARLALVFAALLLLIAAPGAIAQVPPPSPAGDTDGDMVPDPFDACPTVAGVFPGGCPPPTRPEDGGADKPAPVAATQIGSPSASITKYSRGLQFGGGISANGYMTPKRLTIWLPKGIKVSSAPAKPCSAAFVKTLQLHAFKRCAKMFAGRVGSEEHSGYFAFAGPKVGSRQRLFLRARAQEAEDGEEIVGFGTGWIDPAKGAFGPKLTLELGQLGLSVRMVELYSAAENKVKPLQGTCTGKFRVRLETAQGNTDKTFSC